MKRAIPPGLSPMASGARTAAAEALRARILETASASLEAATNDWLNALPPSERQSALAFADRIAPNLVALLRELPLSTWERLLALKATLENEGGKLSPATVAALPFLPEEARAAIGGRR